MTSSGVSSSSLADASVRRGRSYTTYSHPSYCTTSLSTVEATSLGRLRHSYSGGGKGAQGVVRMVIMGRKEIAPCYTA